MSTYNIDYLAPHKPYFCKIGNFCGIISMMHTHSPSRIIRYLRLPHEFIFNLRTQYAALSVSYTYLVFSTGREERLPRYRIRGFEEVVTPNIFSCDLWKVSGHYQNYKDDMSNTGPA